MFLKNKSTYSGFIFIFFFVLQQIISFVSVSYNFVSIYWLTITAIVFIIGINLPLISKKYLEPFIFMLVCFFGALLTLINGNSFGDVLTKSVYSLFAFIGFVYLSEKRLDLRLFDILLISLFVFFYFTFFSLDIIAGDTLYDNLFGHSSSNTIAISLNIVLFVYYILSKSYHENNKIRLLLFSIINLILIVIQNSRAGIIISFILLVLIVSDFFNKKSKRFYISFLLVSLIASFMVYIYLDQLSDIIDIENMQGTKSLEEDIRGTAQQAFFDKMDFNSFLLGYPNGYEFTFGMTRTFNAFLDFWNRFGIIPFLYFLYLFLRRIIYHKNFSISLLYFIPLFVYSLVESLWGGTLWDILIYVFLFYSKENYYVQETYKINL